MNTTIHRIATGIVITEAGADDDETVEALFGELHHFNAALDPRFALADGWEHVLAEHLAHTRSAGHGVTLLAWMSDRPAGFLMMDGHTDSPLFLHRHWAEVLALYVTSEVRGQGLADQLVTTGLRWAHSRGFDRVQLHVTATNERARAFYQTAGFAPVQEIWRRELGPTVSTPAPNPTCEAIYDHSHNLLTVTAHQPGGSDGTCSTPGRTD